MKRKKKKQKQEDWSALKRFEPPQQEGRLSAKQRRVIGYLIETFGDIRNATSWTDGDSIAEERLITDVYKAILRVSRRKRIH